jgi:hypothetical protein
MIQVRKLDKGSGIIEMTKNPILVRNGVLNEEKKLYLQTIIDE